MKHETYYFVMSNSEQFDKLIDNLSVYTEYSDNTAELLKKFYYLSEDAQETIVYNTEAYIKQNQNLINSSERGYVTCERIISRVAERIENAYSEFSLTQEKDNISLN